MCARSGGNQYSEVLAILEKYLANPDTKQYGFGIDTQEAAPRDHPMAYGLFASGFARLYQATGNKDYLGDAVNCLKKLRELSSSDDYLCWGLLMDWKGLPESHPYAITTAIAGEGFLAVYQQTREHSYRHDLYRIGSWLTEALEYENIEEGTACPWFAPQFPVLAINVASKVGALLVRLGARLREPEFKIYGERALRFVRLRQSLEGFWVYGEPSEYSPDANQAVDNIHTAYTLEGLLNYYSSLPVIKRWLNSELKRRISEGINFYGASLFTQGKPLEKLLLLDETGVEKLHARSGASRKWRVKPVTGQRFLVFTPTESRLWGAGAAMATMAKAYRLGMGQLETMQNIFYYFRDNLITDKGHFKFKSDDESCYIRHEAHAFNGLCEMLYTLKIKGS